MSLCNMFLSSHLAPLGNWICCCRKFTQFAAVANFSRPIWSERSRSDIVWICWNLCCKFGTVRSWIDGWDFLLRQTVWICYNSKSISQILPLRVVFYLIIIWVIKQTSLILLDIKDIKTTYGKIKPWTRVTFKTKTQPMKQKDA
jgi:hypothetical protein